MKRSRLISFLFALLLIGALNTPAHGAGATGAIFTTTIDGSTVNGNHYDSKCDVYLDGGPGPNAPAKAAGLPDGDYYFQVTDPSGKQLLSTDPVSNRQFQVLNGVIVAYTGVGGPIHPTGFDKDHLELGATTIRLANDDCPNDYLNSSNDGGVYKVWATPVGDFVGDPLQVDNDCGKGCYHGFLPSRSKTDNFKANPSVPTFCLTIKKEVRVGPGGVFAPEEGWLMTLTDPLMVETLHYTDPDGAVEVCGLTAGIYTVTEALPGGYTPVGLIVNGQDAPMLDTTFSFTGNPPEPGPVIVFQNEKVEGCVC